MSSKGRVHVRAYDALLLRAIAEEVRARLPDYDKLNHAWGRHLHRLDDLARRVDAGGLERDGVVLIACERVRQIEEEWYDYDHDAGHTHKEIITHGVLPLLRRYADGHIDGLNDPWQLATKHGHNNVRMLTIMGAMVAAELDRILLVVAPRGQQL